MGLLSGSNIVVIGGTTGIGLSAAKAFLKEGAKVLVTGHQSDSCKSAEKELDPTVSLVMHSDARVEGESERVIAQLKETFGPLTGLLHVAGGSGRRWGDGPLHELTLEGWNKTLELNLTSVMLSNRAAIKEFTDSSTPGTILNISSVLASSPSPTFFSTHTYTASKSAINGFSQSVASYYANKNIRVNVLSPALVETPMSERAQQNQDIMTFIQSKQPLDGGRIGVPSDLDGLAIYFMSSLSRFTTGQIVAVDGGWSISDGQQS